MIWIPYAIATGAVAAIAVVGARATDVGPWYRALNKPRWNPPDWAFPVVWTCIYITSILAIGMAWNSADFSQQGVFLILCAVNAVLNMAWSIIFFKMRRPVWALAEVVIFWVSILALIVYIGTWNTTAALILSPYLIWVTIAGVLNTSIVRLN